MADTGGSDAHEAAAWDAFFERAGLQELWQAQHTHRTTSGSSRLDRVYGSWHPVEQLDRDFFATMGAAPPGLSAHEPVLVGCRGRLRHDGDAPRMQQYIVDDPRFADAARAAYKDRLFCTRDAPLAAHPLGRLQLLKDALWEAYRAIDAASKGRTAQHQDVVTTALRCLRHWQAGRIPQAQRLWETLPPDLERPPRPGQGTPPQERAGQEQLRHLTLTAARSRLLDDMQKPQPLDQHARCNHGNTVNRQLARLRSRPNTGLAALSTPDGHVTSRPDDMAEILREHWGGVFKARATDALEEKLWLDRIREQCRPSDARWHDPKSWAIRRRHIRKAIATSGHSAPGPDGIIYSAYAAVPDIASEVLFEVATAMESMSDAELLRWQPNFNLGLLCCLAKGDGELAADGRRHHTAGSTRPLAIVDTANRLLANAMRLAWESRWAEHISASQQGFLPGRSLLANVLGLETDAQLTAATADAGAVLLLDFQAAFPSLSHSFLLQGLEAWGLPRAARRQVALLYAGVACRISLQGRGWGTFPQTAGIRQGCPLSPLLFAAMGDILLRTLSARPSLRVWAYADDTALRSSSWHTDRIWTYELLGSFSKATHLHLNWRKSILLPLWLESPETVQRKEHALAPQAPVGVASAAKYLGYMVGPGSAGLSWDCPTAKMRERLRDWRWSELGLQFAAKVFEIYLLPVLQFVAQLKAPTPTVFQTEAHVLSKIFPGPHHWLHPAEAWACRRRYGAAFQVRSVHAVSLATRLRVHHAEAASQGGLRAAALEEQVADAWRRSDFVVRLATWADWRRDAPSLALTTAVRTCRDRGITLRSLYPTPAVAPTPGAAPPSTRQGIAGGDTRRRSRSPRRRPAQATPPPAHRPDLQRRATTALQEQLCGDDTAAVRRRLQRFRARRATDADARGCMRRLRLLAPLVPPRVHHALVGSLHNRWCTTRRFQQRQRGCLLGCGSEADALEHYAGCPRLRQALRPFLQGHDPGNMLHFWIGLASPADPAHCIPIALGCYAAYRRTNDVRAGHMDTSEDTTIRALRQYFREGARGHTRAAAALSLAPARVPACP
jgi:hypothetical protein